jgi:hypothetical protein
MSIFTLMLREDPRIACGNLPGLDGIVIAEPTLECL